MIIAEVTTLFLYLASMMFLPEYFGPSPVPCSLRDEG